MNKNKKAALSLISIAAVIIVGILSFDFSKSKNAAVPAILTQSVDDPFRLVAKTADQKASGIVTRAYVSSGRGYIDIDYVDYEKCSSDEPCGSGERILNRGRVTATLELSSSTRFLIRMPCVDKNDCEGDDMGPITFERFKGIFDGSNTVDPEYLKLDSWDLVIEGGSISQIIERFRP